MKPLIREVDKKYIEVIGHYDNPVLCAKLTLLAEMYAIEHKNGYAKFNVEDYDKLSFINDTLEFDITDLTGCTWTCTSISATSGYGRFYVNYTLNGNDYEYSNISIGYEPNMEGTRPTASTNEVTIDNAGMLTLSINDILEFTGGTDATNSTLIAWLQANGTLIAPILPNDYAITHTLTNLTQGNVTIQITPDSGYTYPSSISVTNGTLVSYDNTTGIAVISGDDTTSVSVICEEAAKTLISFSISGVGTTITCQAEEGMTWYEWCNSSYNTSHLTCEDNNASPYAGYGYIPGVVGSDKIVDGGNYIVNSGGSND